MCDTDTWEGEGGYVVLTECPDCGMLDDASHQCPATQNGKAAGFKNQ